MKSLPLEPLPAELTWVDFMAAAEEALLLAEPLTAAARRQLRAALEAEAAKLIAEQAARRGEVC